MMRPDPVALVSRWQRELRLTDWRIDVEYVRELRNPAGQAVYGLCFPQVDAKTAKIQLLDPSTPWGKNDPAVEEIVVHELLHLHFAPLSGTTKAEIVAEEQAVWAIQEAIAKVSSREAQMVARAMKAHAVQRAPWRQKAASMDPKVMAAALDAIVKEDGKAALEILKGLLTGAAGGGDAPAEEPPAEDAPAEAAAPAPAPPEEEQPPMEAAATPEEPKAAAAPPKAAAATAPAKAMVVASAPAKPSPFETRLDNFERNTLLERQGHRLQPSVRAWAATLPLSIVQGLIAASPDEISAPRAAQATRGAGHGMQAHGAQLPPDQAAELHRAMGIIPAGASNARVDEGGQFVRPIETPTQCRARLKAEQKGQA